MFSPTIAIILPFFIYLLEILAIKLLKILEIRKYGKLRLPATLKKINEKRIAIKKIKKII